MSSDIDYESVEIPTDKSPEEYHYSQRRADILRQVNDVGHPRLLNQRELADRYDTSPPNIHNDLQVLAEYLDGRLGNRRVMVSETVFNKAISELIEDRQWRDAARTLKEYNEFIDEYRRTNALEDRIEQLETLQEQQA
ncbi:hypothetical protein V5735_01550 (plasmid) [Haladaptatus sp. SPP-AMP-3]|uniref:hypothetical protein n=1 Tax=Haladaptatus sp. SPP-AMP-3 TaxID=3121295 RepID=UPI003C2B810A